MVSSSTGHQPQACVATVYEYDGTLRINFYSDSAFRYYVTAVLSSQQLARSPQLIITPQSIPSPFFQKLIEEINKTYALGCYTSVWVCLRKLFENLLIELLRTKYGVSRIELYYDTSRGRFNDFSILINNLKDNIDDFQIYTQEFDQEFFNFLNEFREHANRTAHSIDIIENNTRIENKANYINHYCQLLCDVIRRIRETPTG